VYQFLRVWALEELGGSLSDRLRPPAGDSGLRVGFLLVINPTLVTLVQLRLTRDHGHPSLDEARDPHCR
jgi:hypothetical protein